MIISDENLPDLIKKFSPLVKRLCISPLARLIHEEILWVGNGQRRESDWYLAEEFANDHFTDQTLLEDYTEKFVFSLGTEPTLPTNATSNLQELSEKQKIAHVKNSFLEDLTELFYTHRNSQLFYRGLYTGPRSP